MSQSPLDPNQLDGLDQYQNGWRALNRLLHENRSFSGRETNNAFLNCGKDKRFADVSTAIGWDFPDDARAVAPVDWDQDGDLDLWVANRTAPRVRLLENRLESDSGFVAFLLAGDGKKTNRDAVGARVEVHLEGEEIPLLRTLHAGQSFLLQTSRWLHFGLGEKAITKVIVHWPGGDQELFSGATSGKFFYLVQGTGKAEPRAPRSAVAWKPGSQEVAPPSSVARMIPPAGHVLPPVDGLLPDSLTLIGLWSHTCPHCKEELKSWARGKEKMKKAGIKIIPMSVDLNQKEKCEAFLAGIEGPFELKMASAGTVESLDAFQSSLVDLWKPIPVPSSFLIDERGEVLVIYRGPVEPEQIIQDAKIAGMNTTDRRAAASPFNGIWLGGPTEGSPLRTAQQLVQRNQIEPAIDYLKLALSKEFSRGNDLDRGDSYFLLGSLLGQKGRVAEAVGPLEKAREFLPHDLRVLRLLATGYFETNRVSESLEVLGHALKLHPNNVNLLIDLGRFESRRGDPGAAVDHLAQALKLAPTQPQPRYYLARALLKNGQPESAINHFKQILRAHPRVFEAANDLARVLAAHPKESIRSGKEALALARRLCQVTRNRNPEFLLTLALAEANLGNFGSASATLKNLQKAVPPDSNLGRRIKAVEAEVLANKPYRYPEWKD